MQTSWEHRFAARTAGMKSSFIRELLKVTNQPDVISFGGGFPAGELFPLERTQAACEKVIKEHGRKALQYATTEGYDPLRDWIVEFTAKQGLKVARENILLTSGSQQGLDLLGRIFINRGDRVLTETPTYLGALQAWNAYGAEYETIENDDDGLIIEQLEAAIGRNIKFQYILPNFQNPMGVSLSLERRKKLVQIANQSSVPLIEDDPYGALRFEGEALPSVAQLDAEYNGCSSGHLSGNVIYTSTFSKILSPGLRLGWVIAPEEVMKKLVQAKQGSDLQSSTFDQYVAYELARGDWLDDHIALIRKVYKERRDTMLEAFAEYMPEGTSWTTPKGGLFLWLRLPEGCNSVELFNIALEEKVAYVPGTPFYPNSGPLNTMRLNFSASDPERIHEGVRRLANMVKRSLVMLRSAQQSTRTNE